MTDKDFNGLMRQLGMHQRRKVVRSLMTGNDAQCFTTQQYAEAYHRICHRNRPEGREWWIKYLTELTPMHLKSVGMVEVSPNVWGPDAP
jgi:hypothetical protein